jgi:outer membrane lipoprotein carrier protein
LVFLVINGLIVSPVICNTPKEKPNDLETILKGVESRYSVTGFSANFFQESTLKAMDITDTASGRIVVKRPGMMRWEYDTPEKQLIITDSKNLWIYRPADNQVMVGNAPEFFRDGKGAGFLSDIGLLRKKFDIHQEVSEPDQPYILKLIPIEKNLDFSELYLFVEQGEFMVKKIITRNTFGDETTIRLENLAFDILPEDNLFSFEVPKGVDILEISE